MDSVFEKNLQALAKFQPNSYRKIIEFIEGKGNFTNYGIDRILLAHQDEIIINIVVFRKGNEYLLCNHENPINEAYSWIDKYIDPMNKAEIVFGLGMGFHLDVLITSFENKKVIIVEPDIELFYQILKIRNLEFIIEKSELFLDEKAETVVSRLYELLWDTEKGGVQCQPFEVYSDIFDAAWEELRSKFIKKVENFTVNISTRRMFGDLWTYNYIKNLDKIDGAANAAGLAGGFKGIPGILVSAGPSLQKNIHLINELKDKCVIIAAGTAVNILEDSGITPHFMVGIDAGKGEADRHKRVKNKDIYFLYSNQVSTGSLENYAGPKFLMNYSVDRYTAEFLEKTGVRSEYYLSGPTVSNTCFDILYKMGCDPIVLLGQDLAFTGEKIYSSDISGKGLNQITEKEKEGLLIKKDIYGNDVYTKTSFISMKNWFEGYFEELGDKTKIINATEGGLNIEFARNDTLLNVINNHNFKPQEIAKRIEEIYRANLFSKDISSKLSEYKESINSEIIRLEEFAKEQLKLVDLIKRDIYHPSKDKRAFDKVVIRVNELTDRVTQSSIYASLLQNTIEIDFFLIKAQVDRAIKYLKTYEEVKDIFIDAVIKQNDILNDSLDKLKEILNERNNTN